MDHRSGGLSFANDKEEYYFTTAKSMSVTYGKRDTVQYTQSGYWKQLRDDKAVSHNDDINSNGHIGMKKDFIFCWGKPPSGIQTKWILSEYRLLPTGFPHETFDAALLAKVNSYIYTFQGNDKYDLYICMNIWLGVFVNDL